jgi:hypothetical protein
MEPARGRRRVRAPRAIGAGIRLARSPNLPGAVLLKVGTLDDPSVFGGPQMVIYTVDKQSFHTVPEGVPSFERAPG